ncbi:MAG: hypothetical protein ABSH15_14685 [Verrucomicrobiota bacterium]|jgi:hypothetical protein
MRTFTQTHHNRLIAKICERHVARTDRWIHHFAEAVWKRNSNAAWKANWPVQKIKQIVREVAGNRVPDAFKIDSENKHLWFWEVEVSHPIDQPKANVLAQIAIEVDDWGWELKLVTVDRYGNDNEVFVIDGVGSPARLLNRRDYEHIMVERERQYGA